MALKELKIKAEKLLKPEEIKRIDKVSGLRSAKPEK